MRISSFPKVVLYFIFVILCCFDSFSQEIKDTNEIELKTLELFTNKKWDDLIEVGNNALKEKNDYYYLRLRLGIAYYEKQNYSDATQHFLKALEFNSNDELSNEYLYYCYFLNGRNEEARKLSKTFSSGLLKKIGLSNSSAIDFITANAGTKVANEPYSDSKNPNYLKSASFFELGLKHFVKNNFSLLHLINTFNQDTYLGKLTQNQYYIQGAIPLKNNWTISPSLHFLQVTFESPTTILPKIKSNNSYFVGSISIKKSVKKFDFSFGTSLSNIASIRQNNHFGTISYSVFGNSKLILGLTDYVHSNDNYATVNNSVSTYLYFEPLKFATIKLSYFKNQKSNINEENGYLVNNSSDLTTSRVGALINFRINKNITLFTLYNLENKQESIQKFDYKYNVFLAGIKIDSPF